MIRRLVALALALALTTTVVGHIPGFEGMSAAEPLSAVAQSGIDAMVLPSGEGPVRGVLYDANGCKGNRLGLSGPCSFNAVPSSPSMAGPPRDLLALHLSTAAERLERSWPSGPLRPPNLLT